MRQMRRSADPPDRLLLDRQMRTLEKEFVEGGGLTERLYRVRSHVKKENRTNEGIGQEKT